MHTPGIKLGFFWFFFQLHRGTFGKTLSLVCVIFPFLLMCVLWVMSNTRNATKLCFIDMTDGAKRRNHTSLHSSCARRALTQSKSWKGLLGKVFSVLQWFLVPLVHLFVSCHSDSLEVKYLRWWWRENNQLKPLMLMWAGQMRYSAPESWD